jgi:hypothetical protein
MISMQSPTTFIIQRPLLPLAAAATIANVHPREIVMAMEDGRIPYAFHIEPSTGQRDYRVYTPALKTYLDGQRSDPRMETPARLQQILSTLFPAPVVNGLALPHFAGSLVAGTNLGRVLSCSNHTIQRLIAAGHLRAAPRAQFTGPGSSPRIYRDSIIKWLTQRRIT